MIRFYAIIAFLLLAYTSWAGLLFPLPDLGAVLGQSARNIFFHVPMWFTMYLMMFLSCFWSLYYLATFHKYRLEEQWLIDLRAREAAAVGIFFGVLGLITGILWSRVTWSEGLKDWDPVAWWPWDPKQTLALIALFIYVAYFLLRGAIKSFAQRARFAAVYNLFAAASLLPLTLIIPRMVQSLHPGGKEGDPAFNALDNQYRLIFYPAVLGFMALALWLWQIRIQLYRYENRFISR